MESNGQHGGGRRSRGGQGGRADQASLKELFDRLPPHSIESEMCLLGSLILDPRVATDVLPLVAGADDFYRESHGTIYQTIVELIDERHALDLVQLVDTLRDAGTLEQIGGEEYLVQLAEAVPSAVNAVHYAKAVSDKARLRKLIDISAETIYQAYHTGELDQDPVQQILDGTQASIFKVAERDQQSDMQDLGALLQQEIVKIENAKGQGITGLQTGYDKLDETLSGLQSGEMIIVAARPSMGKTALALNIAEQVALGGVAAGVRRDGSKTIPVGLFSLEMSKSAIAQRLISARSGIDSHKIRTGSWSEGDFQKLIRACSELSEAPIYIDDTANLTIMGLRARARRMHYQYGVKMIMIDYLQLLTSPGQARESRQVEVSAISRGVKSIARELDIPVICLAQLNRGNEQREGKRPHMSDLRESGSIEQDADVVALLHREAYYHRGDPTWDPGAVEFDEENRDKLNLAEVIIAKQRNGPTGIVRLTWDSAITRFKNHTEHEAQGGYGGYGGGNQGGSYGGAYDSPSSAAGGHAEVKGFAPGAKTGPVSDFRDGGGPDDDIDDLPI